jgi:alkylation response protein AidB-like acyl-CoA dehydrogenase
MELLLEPHQDLLRDSAARLVQTCMTLPGATLWRQGVDAGWLSLLLPEEAEGSGLFTSDYLLVLREVARHSEPQVLRSVMPALAALAHASGRMKTLCGQVAAGRALLVSALEGERSAFRPVGPLPRLIEHGGVRSIEGRHLFVPDVDAASDLIILVQDKSATTSLVCLPVQTEGIEVTARPSAGGSTICDVEFTRVAIADEQILVRGTEATEIASLLRRRLMLGASIELLAIGDTSLKLALDHVKLREQFGRRIGSFQAIQHRLVDAHVGLELLHSFIFRVAADLDAGTASDATVAAVKAKAGTIALQAIRTALQVHGAMGYTAEHDLNRLFKRALTLDAIHGNSAAQQAVFLETAGVS